MIRVNKRIIAVICVIALAIAGVLLLTGNRGNSYLRIGYVGNQTSKVYNGSYMKLDGTMTHKMRSDDTELFVDIVTESGKISLLITDPDGKRLYSGNELDTCSFSVMTEGKADITITADDHKGSFSFSFTKPER